MSMTHTLPPSLSPSRILRLYAEENAIDDTIYYLGEALRREVITPEAFLKVMENTKIISNRHKIFMHLT